MGNAGGRVWRRLLVIGEIPHHLDGRGRLCPPPGLAAQLDVWAGRFDEVRCCAVLADGPPPAGSAPYESTNVALVPLAPAGGQGLRAKLGVLRAMVGWQHILRHEIAGADVVHIRAPSNIALLAMPVAQALRARRYAIYTASWTGFHAEAVTYQIQRRWLGRWFGGIVHAYVPSGPSSRRRHVRSTFSPVLRAAQLDELGERWVRSGDWSDRPIRIVCAGRFSDNKNQITLVRALAELQSRGLEVECRFIGEGDSESEVRRAAQDLDSVRFLGQVPLEEVYAAMSWADLNVLPSFGEGFPKVLLEGMAVGALPIVSDIPMHRSMVSGRGWVFDPHDPAALAHQIEAASRITSGERCSRIRSCSEYSRRHTMEAFGVEIDEVLERLRNDADRS